MVRERLATKRGSSFRRSHGTSKTRSGSDPCASTAPRRRAYAVVLPSKGSRDLRPTQDNVARIALAEASRAVYKAMREE